ncbi:hypothetical protein [Bacteroides congonensis]
MNKITTLISILSIAGLFYSCEERPGMEYTIQAKHLSVQESTIYVDGFLAKGTPAFAGDENEPADRLGIPFVNGFGRKLSVKFIDRSSETGLTIEDGEVQLSYQGDKQYAYFPISGIPAQDGSVPVSFEIYEDGEKIGTTVTKTIPIWPAGTQRPAREFIPTSEKPFVLLGGEINWVNQSAPTTAAKNEQEFWYARMPNPSTQIKVSGSTYSCVANLRYNSIIIANNAIRPDFTGENNKGTLTVFVPTPENLEQYPEAFTLKNGSLSHVWGEKDIFFHGTNSKPISVGMWDESTPDLIVSGSRSRPLSSLSWTVSSVKPYGSYINEPGNYKIYVKYANTDAGNDIIQYFPKHPVTGEAGWVPFEFTITENPIPGFVADPGITTNTPDMPTYNADWEPTESDPVKAVRAELVFNHKTKVLTKGQKLGASAGSIRIWFATYKPEGATTPTGYNFKAHDDNKINWFRGFYTPDVVKIAGAGSKLGAGTANKITNQTVHFFEDPELNEKYFISYADFNADANTLLNKAGTFTFTFESLPNSGTASPKFEKGFTCPVNIIVQEAQ